MNKTIEQVTIEADKKIPREEVSTRDSGYGSTFSYLTAHYVVARMNEVFGNCGWDSETVEMRQVGGGDPGKPTAYVAKVRINAIVSTGDGGYMKVVKEGYGFGADKPKRDGTCNNPHEFAVKEAESDAFKRAARQFGMSLGLALYSKEQENVEEPTKILTSNSQPTNPSITITNAVPLQPIAKDADRSGLNKKITAMSKVVIAKRLKTLDELKSDMKSKYNVDSTMALSDAQAGELYGTLETLANGH